MGLDLGVRSLVLVLLKGEVPLFQDWEEQPALLAGWKLGPLLGPRS